MIGPVTRRVSEAYYRDHFKPFDLVSTIGMDDFDRREFAWFNFDDPQSQPSNQKKMLFRRNHRFDTIKDLLDHLPGIAPKKFYFGAVYKTRWNGSIIGVPWDRNELHFDIDINEFDFVRRAGTCDCARSDDKDERKKTCPACFQLVKEAVMFLIDTLHEDFGIDKSGASTWFSGARGFHVRYPGVSRLGGTELEEKFIRQNIINYLSVVKEFETVKETPSGRKVKHFEANVAGEIDSKTLKERIDRTVYRWFFSMPADAMNAMLRAGGARIQDIALKLIVQLFNEGKNMGDVARELVTRQLMTDRQMKKLRDTVLMYGYPRYDGSATYDVRKVLKVPGSVDCSTGLIVTKVKDISTFAIDDVDHVFNHVSS